jgi:protein required for attachment to host cells
MMLPNGALVAVVDGTKLVMFKNIGHDDVQLSALPTPAIDDSGHGQPGHQSSAANPDDETRAQDGFAVGVAEVLNKRALEHDLEALLVIAAPRTLGELRKHWRNELQVKLVGEIPKDLTGHSADQIATAITHHA